MERLPPVDCTVNVPLEPHEAFALFTAQMRRWWPFNGHSCSGAGADVRFEPRLGGAVTEVAADGQCHPWGTLTEWNPPHALAMTWHPGLPEAEATQLRVTFSAGDRSTDVRIVHDGWEARGAEAAGKRGQYERGWPHVLAALREAATRP